MQAFASWSANANAAQEMVPVNRYRTGRDVRWGRSGSTAPQILGLALLTAVLNLLIVRTRKPAAAHGEGHHNPAAPVGQHWARNYS